MKLRDFKQIGKALVARSLEQLMAGNFDAITNLSERDVGQIPKDKRPAIGRALYCYSKTKLVSLDLDASLKYLKLARILDPQNQLLSVRLDLLRRLIVSRETVRWRLSLQNLQRDLKLLCHRTQCHCQSHFQIATCKDLIDGNFDFTQQARGLTIYTLGPYYSHSYRGGWTKLLKAIKHPPYQSQALEPMADILADFIMEKTELLGEVDVLVPIPPSTRKVVERGFAPNYIVAERLSTRLALPVRKVLVRYQGPDTDKASEAELASQFEVQQSQGKYLTNLSVLLVEDIWTKGRTLPICAQKLQSFQPKSIFAVALARTLG